MSNRIPMTSDLFIAHHAEIEDALNEAVRLALLDHKRAGNPIAGWRDGKLAIIPAHEIPVEDPLVTGAHQNGANGAK
jgi:hypothetical protein